MLNLQAAHAIVKLCMRNSEIKNPMRGWVLKLYAHGFLDELEHIMFIGK